MSQSRVYLRTSTYNLSMRCVPHEEGFHYLWEKMNNDLTPRAHGIYSSELTIINLRPEDSGQYQCIISNATGTIASSYSKLIVRSTYIYIYIYIYICMINVCTYAYECMFYVGLQQTSIFSMHDIV